MHKQDVKKLHGNGKGLKMVVSRLKFAHNTNINSHAGY